MRKRLTENLISKILIAIWLLFVLSYLGQVNYFSLSIEKTLPSLAFGDYRGDPLLSGDVISLEYQSHQPKLESIGIRFNTFYKLNKDTISFRIKEVGRESWYFERDYKSDQFQQNKFFSFEFPTIEDSVGKTYHIEIKSLYGVSGDYVAVSSPLGHSVTARHLFPKEKLLADARLMVHFGFQKFLFLISDADFLSHLILYSTPLFFYVVYVFVGSSMGAFSVVIFSSVLFDILFVKEYSAFFMLSVIFGWGMMAWHHRVESRVSTSVFLTIFSLSPVLFLTGQVALGDKAGVWAYMFLAFSMTQLLYEIKERSKDLIPIKEYWRDLVLEGRNMGMFIYLVTVGEIEVAVERVRLGLAQQSKLPAGRMGKETGRDGASDLVTLVVYRWQTPMVKTYIYTSRVLAYLIIIVVKGSSLAIRLGPYGLFGWLVWSIVNQFSGYLNFYNGFFIHSQNSLFWNQIGTTLVFIYAIVLSALVLISFIRKYGFRKKTIIGVVLLYLCIQVSQFSFNRATPYRDDINVWSVSPKETAEPWVDVTIAGRNFGEAPFVGKILIDGVEQRIIRWSRNEITFRTNPTTTRSGRLVVRGYNKTSSNVLIFTYTGNR